MGRRCFSTTKLEGVGAGWGWRVRRGLAGRVSLSAACQAAGRVTPHWHMPESGLGICQVRRLRLNSLPIVPCRGRVQTASHRCELLPWRQQCAQGGVNVSGRQEEVCPVGGDGEVGGRGGERIEGAGLWPETSITCLCLLACWCHTTASSQLFHKQLYV